MFRSFDPDSSMSDSNGASLGINTYDEYGNPGGPLTGRYGYTGQAWIPSAQLWYLNARMYSSAIGGRFMQTDPIGTAGGINLYAYVGNDPLNFVDPLGLQACDDENIQTAVSKDGSGGGGNKCPQIVIVTAMRLAGTQIQGAVPAPTPRTPQPKPTPKPKPKPKYNPRYNYCGGEGGTPLPNMISGISINDLCYAHDLCFGGSGTTFSTCNLDFSVAILERFALAGMYLQPFPFGGLFTGIPVAATAYFLITVGGKTFYVPKGK